MSIHDSNTIWDQLAEHSADLHSLHSVCIVCMQIGLLWQCSLAFLVLLSGLAFWMTNHVWKRMHTSSCPFQLCMWKISRLLHSLYNAMYLYIYPSSVYSLIAKNKNEIIKTRLAVLCTLGSPGYDTWLLIELSSKGVLLSFLCGLTAKKEWRF